MLPVCLVQDLIRGVIAGRARDYLHEPRHLPVAVEALERQLVAADLVLQVGRQGWRQVRCREVGALISDDPVPLGNTIRTGDLRGSRWGQAA